MVSIQAADQKASPTVQRVTQISASRVSIFLSSKTPSVNALRDLRDRDFGSDFVLCHPDSWASPLFVCNHVYVLRVRSRVNLTRRRSTNACKPIENRTRNKREDRPIDLLTTRPIKPMLGQGRRQTSLPSRGPISLAKGRTLCSTTRTMHRTHSLLLVCLHKFSALVVSPHFTLSTVIPEVPTLVGSLFLLNLG